MAYARPTDVPPPPEPGEGVRSLRVHVHPSRVEAGALAGGVVIVIDALRASVTITAALANGAARVVPALSVEEARGLAEQLGRHLPHREDAAPPPQARRGILLGGERGGVLIEGFDLDNSPQNYSRERVAGRTVVFTTTNGTAALLHARQAARVLVGSFANLSAVCDGVAGDARPVHILCAGTRDEIGVDDCLPAGAMVERLVAAGRTLLSDDSARLCRLAWAGACALPGGIPQAMRESRGGRNLVRIGLGHEVDSCATLDTLGVVPEFDAARGEIRLGAG